MRADNLCAQLRKHNDQSPPVGLRVAIKAVSIARG